MSFHYKAILVGILLLSGILIALLVFSFPSKNQLPSEKTTTVIIKTEPADATIIISEKRIRKNAPVTLKNIPIGEKITVRAITTGSETVSQTVTITDSPQQTITLNLKALIQQAQQGSDDLDHELSATIKPSYLEKIKEQPFWEILPYYDPLKHFVIEYKDSDDKILITTFARGQEENFQKDTLSYREEAREWLQTNGAKLNQLRIEYNPATL